MLGMGRPGGVAFTLDAAGVPADLAADSGGAAFRIVAEALTNVVRHAHATRCDVTICHSDAGLRLVVSDNGHGPSVLNGSGHGMASMRRRATDLNGRLDVVAAESAGTLVTAVLPMETS